MVAIIEKEVKKLTHKNFTLIHYRIGEGDDRADRFEFRADFFDGSPEIVIPFTPQTKMDVDSSGLITMKAYRDYTEDEYDGIFRKQIDLFMDILWKKKNEELKTNNKK